MLHREDLCRYPTLRRSYSRSFANWRTE
jgi:hypothetical protein